MDLTFVVDRLKSHTQGFKAMGGAADLDAAINGALVMPAAYAMPASDDEEDLGMTGVTESRVTEEFTVVYVVSNLKDPKGAAALAGLAPARLQVRAALVGWVPDPATGEAVTKTGGRLLAFNGDGRLWWADKFQYSSYFRSE